MSTFYFIAATILVLIAAFTGQGRASVRIMWKGLAWGIGRGLAREIFRSFR